MPVYARMRGMIEMRKTANFDIPLVMSLYDTARAHMRASGNMKQWVRGYPQQSVLENDIQKGASFVYCRDGEIEATFYFAVEAEPTYGKIYGGEWLNGAPYGVVHRLAVKTVRRGTARRCLDFCFSKIQNIRIDTHEDNVPMRCLLEKSGFLYCGIIYLLNGDKRLAFQKIN